MELIDPKVVDEVEEMTEQMKLDFMRQFEENTKAMFAEMPIDTLTKLKELALAEIYRRNHPK